ncbi:hypothetical protein [Holdemania filiformis]|uniref:hypothetical protein n=1 Tax=Holdemania filiformis TaxID=61171 RepID=UPI00267475F7|nr:hypothetical protein [Holdemania filiformis]
MRKLLLFSIGVMLALGGCAEEKPCIAEKGIVCYDEEAQQYQVEEGAKIRVMVENEAYGQALEELWNKEHPEQTDVIEPVVVQSFDAATWLGYKTDIALLWSNDAAQIINNFMPVQPELEVVIQEHAPRQFGELLNVDGLRYVPMSYYGLVFSTNMSMLSEMGYDVSDENGDGLADQFDSFEELMKLADEWGGQARTYHERQMEAVFPFAISELWASMVFLSADDFRFFASQDALISGMETEEFLETLKFLRAMGEHSWYLNSEESAEEERPAVSGVEDENSRDTDSELPVVDSESEVESEEFPPESSNVKESQDSSEEEEEIILPYQIKNDRAFDGGWLYDVYLEKLISPFSLVGTWMYYNQQEEIEQQDFYFSPMPSWKEKILSPLAKTKGYLLSAGTKYPSAANEVYRIIRSEAGIQAYIDTVDEIPAVTQVDRLENRPNLETEENEEGKESQTIEPYYLAFRNENQRQISYAFSFSQEESMVAFEKDPSVRGWDMLSEIGLIEIAQKVIKQEITPEEAQLELLENSENWMKPFKPVDEELE